MTIFRVFSAIGFMTLSGSMAQAQSVTRPYVTTPASSFWLASSLALALAAAFILLGLQYRKTRIGLENVTADHAAARQETLTLLQALDQTPVGIAIAELDGTFRHLNQRMATLTGFDAEELLGKNLGILFDDAESAAMACPDRACIEALAEADRYSVELRR
ncbi:MAG: PAS domain S-box protein, partial [Magnetospiraceae bacterium]